MTVSPARAKLTAFAVGGFVAGLGGVLLGAVNLTFGPSERYFLVEDSIRLVSIAVIGGLGSLSGAVVGALWVVGLPAFWPENELVPLFTSSIGLLIILLYIPGGFVQIGYYVRDSLLRWVEKRMGPVDTGEDGDRPARVAAPRRAARSPRRCNADGTVLADRAPHRALRRAGRGRRRRVPRRARRGDRAHRQQRRRQVDAAQRDRRLRAEQGLGAAARARRQPASARTNARASGSAARSRPRACIPS